MSTSRRSAILSKLPRSGWDELVHHLLTVEGLTPISSDNHLAVRFFSTKTNLIRLISSMSLIDNATKLVIYFQFLSCFAHKFWYNGTFFIVFMLIVARILLFHTDSVLFFHSACWFNWTVTTPATSRDCIGLSIPPFYGDRPSPSLSFRVGGWVVHAGYADLLNSFFPFNQRNLREFYRPSTLSFATCLERKNCITSTHKLSHERTKIEKGVHLLVKRCTANARKVYTKIQEGVHLFIVYERSWEQTWALAKENMSGRGGKHR